MMIIYYGVFYKDDLGNNIFVTDFTERLWASRFIYLVGSSKLYIKEHFVPYNANYLQLLELNQLISEELDREIDIIQLINKVFSEN